MSTSTKNDPVDTMELETNVATENQKNEELKKKSGTFPKDPKHFFKMFIDKQKASLVILSIYSQT